MDKLLDEDFKIISTPVEAEKHYLPFIKSGKMDLMQVKTELREIHKFDEVDVRITANVLSNASLKAMSRKDGFGSSVFGIALGVILMILGVCLYIYLYRQGFIVFLSYFIIGAGISLTIGSIRAMLIK